MGLGCDLAGPTPYQVATLAHALQTRQPFEVLKVRLGASSRIRDSQWRLPGQRRNGQQSPHGVLEAEQRPENPLRENATKALATSSHSRRKVARVSSSFIARRLSFLPQALCGMALPCYRGLFETRYGRHGPVRKIFPDRQAFRP